MLNIDWTNPTMLIADEGKMLTNGEVYTSVVYLGVDENADNWSEINAEDVPKIEETAEEIINAEKAAEETVTVVYTAETESEVIENE